MTTGWRGNPPARDPPRLPPTTHRPIGPGLERQQSVQFIVGFRWPVRIALTVAPGLAVSSLLLGVLSGQAFLDAANQAGYVLAISFGAMITVLPLAAWGIHIILEFRRTRPAPARPRSKPERTPYPVPVKSKRGQQQTRETVRDKMERALAKGPLPKVGHALREAGDRLVAAPPPQRSNGRYAQDAALVQATVDSPEASMMSELFFTTHYFYGKRITREDFRPLAAARDGNWQAWYAEYKSWVSDEGLGWVDVDGRGTIVNWRFPEHELYERDRMLKRIATQHGFKFPGEGGVE